MNILFLFNRPIIAHQGGVERVSKILATQFVSMGHGVKFLCYSDEVFSHLRDFMDTDQLFIRRSIPVQQKISALTKIIEDNHISVVIDQVQLIDICLLIKNLPNPPKLISVYHSQPFAHYGKERFLMKNYYPTSLQGKVFKWTCLILPSIAQRFYTDGNRRCFKAVLQYADRLCFLSERFIPRFTSIFGDCQPPKLIAINNPNTFVTNEKPDLSGKEKLIIIVGRVYNLSKNMLDFLRMWEKISAQNDDWHAMVVGDGPDLQRLKDYASSHQIRRIEFVGEQKDVKSYFRKASISCVTSINEGWGMVITEAMSQGCIPVSYDSFEAVKDLIKSGENGFITPQFDIDAMVARIQLLINAPDIRLSMSQNAIRSINKFNPALIAEKWIETINSIDQ